MTETMDRLAARIREGNSFIVTSHVRIDGDGIASALAIDLLLKSLGKKSQVLISGPVPHVFKFLPGTDTVCNLHEHPEFKMPEDLDTAIMVDVADRRRLGSVGDLIGEGVVTLSIDHHREGGVIGAKNTVHGTIFIAGLSLGFLTPRGIAGRDLFSNGTTNRASDPGDTTTLLD